MFGNVRTEWWSITGIATYVIGGRNESRDVYLRFRDNSLIIHVSIFLTAAIYYLQGSECILPRTKRSRKSPLSIPFILRDRRFLSPLITEHPTPAHIFLRSPPVIFLIFARNWLNARWRHLALLASLPRFHAPIKIIFYSLNGRNERKKASTWHNQSDPVKRYFRLPLLLRDFNHRLRNRRREDSSSPVKAERNIFMEYMERVGKSENRISDMYIPIVNSCMKMRRQTRALTCSRLKLCAERAKIELLIWNCRSARNQFMRGVHREKSFDSPFDIPRERWIFQPRLAPFHAHLYTSISPPSPLRLRNVRPGQKYKFNGRAANLRIVLNNTSAIVFYIHIT